ncbi:MAG TPA: carboxypeptidase regulatory-like domain-containing protein, partial [Longimicrobiaceae bacterium]
VYSLRAERIGYATVVSPSFELHPGETLDQRLTASGRAVALQGLRVSRRGRRCAGPIDRAIETATLWEEARKALNATSYAERARLYRYDVVRWSRDLDFRTGAVMRDERRSASGVEDHPFVSGPPGELSRRGYVRSAPGDSVEYWGPDADVMLSEEFLSDHCFHVVDGADRSLVGLGFQPVHGRGVPDLAGTLWLDRRTAELRRVEYRYVGGPPASEARGVGGWVEYAHLPGGRWIVRHWTIRMPLVQEAPAPVIMGGRVVGGKRTPRRDVIAIRESGGQVTGTSEGRGLLAAGASPVVTGVVWDSTRNAPLAGARVYLSGTQAEAVSGSDGRYRLEAPGEGTYTLAFSHPELGPLAAVAPTRSITVAADTPATADLAVPGWKTVTPTLCDDSTLHPNHGIVLGRAPAGVSDTALIVGQWARLSVSSVGSFMRTSFVATRPDAQGFYVLCGVAEDQPVQVGLRGAHDSFRRLATVTVPARSAVFRNLDGRDSVTVVASTEYVPEEVR